MAALPTRDEIAGTPTNAEAKAGFGKLWDYLSGLFGTTGNADDARAALGIGNAMGFKNRLINAQGLINQLSVSGTVTLAAGAYGHDCFKAGASGCTYTFATSNNVTTFTITAGSLVQIIEGLNLESGTYVMSWVGTAQGRIAGGTYGASGTVTATVVGGTNTSCEWNTGTLSLPMFEKGSKATLFDYRPFGVEFALCQRYFQIFIGLTFNSYSTAGGSTSRQTVSLPVVMRSTPTPVTITAPGTVVNLSDTDLTGNVSSTAVAYGGVSVGTGRTYIAGGVYSLSSRL